MDYKESGVDIKKGDQFVESIKKKVTKTYGSRVRSGVGGFACLYEVGDRLLAAGTDGVGTKLKLAQKHNIHDGIGKDLVAMCINDILCTGAKPLFFMDYMAMGGLDLGVGDALIESILKGCEESECALIGGETAEMPDMYKAGEYDLAGFAVGEVFEDKLITGQDIKAGMEIIGLPSSGFHSNGYSLLRKIAQNNVDLERSLLVPTQIYWKSCQYLIENSLVSGLAHITGGGFLNVARLNSDYDYKLREIKNEERPTEMNNVLALSQLSKDELYRTFNMGIGMMIITDKSDLVMEYLNSINQKFLRIGSVEKGTGKVLLECSEGVISL